MIKLDLMCIFKVGVRVCVRVVVQKREPGTEEHTQTLQPCGYGIPAEGQTCFSLAHARMHAHMSFPHVPVLALPTTAVTG